MASQIKWPPRAASNLEDICSYIARDSEYYASLFAKRVLNIIQSLSHFPRSGRIVPEYGNEMIREKVYQSYRIVYRLTDGVTAKRSKPSILGLFPDTNLIINWIKI